MKNRNDDIGVGRTVEKIKNSFSTCIDQCENSLRKSLSTPTGWGKLPIEEATSLLQHTIEIMHEVLDEKFAEQKESLLDAIWQYIDDRENGTAVSPDLMYEALIPVEDAIIQAVTDYTQSEQKRFDRESLLSLWCSYIEYMANNLITDVAEGFRNGLKKNLNTQNQDLSL